MSYTLVKSCFKNDDCNHRLRFGAPVHTFRLTRQDVISLFEPGAIFGYIRWRRNAYGTVNWQVIIGQASNNKSLSAFPGIYPGAWILFRARGVVAVRKALKWLDRLEQKSTIPLEDIPPSFWLKAQNARIIRRRLPLYQTPKLEPLHV